MGAFTSRQNAAVEEAEQSSNNAYKYPPRSGNFFGSHFIMGGERFDTPQPESYLFGENADLNFLGNRPTAFPYPPPQASEPTKTLKSLVNIRKESVRFVRVAADKKKSIDSCEFELTTNGSSEQVDGNVLCTAGGGDADTIPLSSSYNIEFTFDADCKCAITIYYFCTEEVSPSGVTLVPRDGLTSETYHYEKGMNQYFSQPGHVFNPQLIPEDDLVYNSTKEQYPVAIHCVVEEGNEDCRQSHTTICVIDHHPDNNSYALRALKQKIFCDGLCYLLQEIYGIENKAVNKSSIDEDLDDHGSECVICMSETRDTLILPCRHLCLCNSCADSLRYQANNCPICRAPFRALLQVRAVQKGVLPHVLHQNPAPQGPGEPVPADLHLPAGYIPVSLIEALNGPPQYVGRSSDADVTDAVVTISTDSTLKDGLKPSSPVKPNVQKRHKNKKHVSTSTSPSEVSAAAGNNNVNANFSDNEQHDNTIPHPLAKKVEKLPTRVSQDKLQIVNERHSLKGNKAIRHSNENATKNSAAADDDDEDDDSENEKLSPLLSPGSTCKPLPKELLRKLSSDSLTNDVNVGTLEENNTSAQRRDSQRIKANISTGSLKSANMSTELEPCTSEDPLCAVELTKSNDKLTSLRTNVNVNNVHGVVNKTLHKKSTSVGNIVGNNSNHVTELKTNVSSLPDMLESPISGNSASTRSSSDSYSSSSSTKQLLSSNTVTVASNAANIIVDDKTALQNAVNV